MANYGMIAGSMASQDVRSYNRAGVVTGLQDSDTIPNGAFVVADNTTALPMSIYGTKETTLENFKKFTTGSKDTAYILDAAEVPQTEDVNGNTYRNGGILSNLEFAADKRLRFRKLVLDDRFYIFDGNIASGTPTVGQYVVATNASFGLTAQAAAGDSFSAVVEAVEPLNNGLQNKGNKYLCRVTKLN